MKKLFFSTAIFLAIFGTAVIAEDFDTTSFTVEVVSGDLDFTVDGDVDGFNQLEVGLTSLDHSYGIVDANVRLSFGTDLVAADTVFFRGEYNAYAFVDESLTLYGIMGVQYTTDTSFEDGIWTIDPSAGAQYQITDEVAIFGEVGYTWDASNDMESLGGYVEAGLPFGLTDSVTLTPSIVRTFDTAVDETNVNIELSFQF